MTELLNLIVYKDGDYLPAVQAGPTLFDLGFIHCDATYDVAMYRSGEIIFEKAHTDRFRQSCAFFDLAKTENINLRGIARELARRNHIEEGLLWMMSWRGIPPSGNPKDLTGARHFVMYVKPYYSFNQSNEATLCLYRDHSRVGDDHWGQKYKNFAWIELTLAQRYASANCYDTAVLLDQEGYIAEGVGFGVGMVKDGVVSVPSKNILQSVTIDVIERICKELGIPFYRTNITPEQFESADEIFLASTSGGAIKVARYHHRDFGGTPTIESIRAAYHKFRTEEANGVNTGRGVSCED